MKEAIYKPSCCDKCGTIAPNGFGCKNVRCECHIQHLGSITETPAYMRDRS